MPSTILGGIIRVMKFFSSDISPDNICKSSAGLKIYTGYKCNKLFSPVSRKYGTRNLTDDLIDRLCYMLQCFVSGSVTELIVYSFESIEIKKEDYSEIFSVLCEIVRCLSVETCTIHNFGSSIYVELSIFFFKEPSTKMS